MKNKCIITIKVNFIFDDIDNLKMSKILNININMNMNMILK